MEVYTHIAKHFDDTRYCFWNTVKKFIEDIPTKSIILDVGCGNGKYSRVRKDLIFISLDITRPLLEIAQEKTKSESFTDLFQVSCDKIPIRLNSIDYAISVAVIHHLDTYHKRLNACLEIIDKVKKDGKILITFWAYEQENPKKRDTKWKLIKETDYLVPWLERSSKIVYWRYYHLFTEKEVKQLAQDIGYPYELVFEYDNWMLIIQK